jgi:hypothetical protein
MEQIENLTGQALYEREVSAHHRQDSGSYKKGSWITTYKGHKFYPLDPDPDDIDIMDIAHALSNSCRWTGHVSQFYSVAQHCVLVSQNCKPENALGGLLHDATEAYLSDISRPVKYSEKMDGYRDIEANLEKVISEKYNLPYPMTIDVKKADDDLLLSEAFTFFRPVPEWASNRIKDLGLEKPSIVIDGGYQPAIAKGLFLRRFFELNGVNISAKTEEN